MSWYPIQKYIEACRNAQQPGDITLFDKWSSEKGIDRYTYLGPNVQWLKLVQTGVMRYPLYFDNDAPPNYDHTVAFKNIKEKKCWIVYQPYYSKSEIEPEVVAWATAHGLAAQVLDTSESWYSPNSTCVVIISLPEWF